jgi:hypothetical protein
MPGVTDVDNESLILKIRSVYVARICGKLRANFRHEGSDFLIPLEGVSAAR